MASMKLSSLLFGVVWKICTHFEHNRIVALNPGKKLFPIFVVILRFVYVGIWDLCGIKSPIASCGILENFIRLSFGHTVFELLL